jgi:DNA repair protein RadC
MPRSTMPFPAVTTTRHRVREFVCAYRPLRDAEGHVVSLPTLVLNNPETAARALTPLLAQEPVEVFAIACLSVRKRLLAWHLCSRGTRTGTQVSMPDVFVPAVLTPGTTGLIVLHNHPSGEPSPSVDDVAITRRLQLSAVILGLDLHDHLIAGEGGQYFSFREAGLLGTGLEEIVAACGAHPTQAPPAARS